MMTKPQGERKSVFATPWFQIFAEQSPEGGEPHYVIQGKDFVVVVALTTDNRILLVRQYRPPVAEVTLELPAGHIEPGETPEQAARRELLEETGHEAHKFQLLANLSPSVARFTNRMYCFFAGDARPVIGAKPQGEAGVSLVLYEGGLRRLIEDKEFYSAPSCVALYLAALRGHLPE
jgi:ADP-ribose pyrophosphatase